MGGEAEASAHPGGTKGAPGLEVREPQKGPILRWFGEEIH